MVYAYSISPEEVRGVARIDRITDRNGNVQSYLYDMSGKLSQVVDTLGREITYAFVNDRLSTVTDFHGRALQFTVD